MIRYANGITLSTKDVSVYLQQRKKVLTARGISLLKEISQPLCRVFFDQKSSREYLQTIEKSELLYISRKTFVDEKNTDPNGRISDFLPLEKDNLGVF